MSLPVVAVIKAKPGKEKEAESMLKGLLAPTHAESGCLLYALHSVGGDPRTFIFIENWASAEALQAHLSSSHIASALARQTELLESLQIMPLEPLVAEKQNSKGSL